MNPTTISASDLAHMPWPARRRLAVAAFRRGDMDTVRLLAVPGIVPSRPARGLAGRPVDEPGRPARITTWHVEAARRYVAVLGSDRVARRLGLSTVGMRKLLEGNVTRLAETTIAIVVRILETEAP